MKNKVYVIGHKSPDLDSITAALAYANLKNKLENTSKYTPAAAGEINKVTKFVLNKFNFQTPKILKNAMGLNLLLVDHNEASQMVAGGDKAEIIEVLDHHKINFSYNSPISFQVYPWGSTASIIFHKYKINKIKIDKNLAGLMLSAVLDDTVIGKSPTCTKIDKKIIKDLSRLSGIKNWKEYGIEMFKKKSSVADLKAEKIIKLDFKDYELKAGKFGFGQIETVDLSEFKKREQEFLEALNNIHKREKYHTIALFITDILKQGSQVLIITRDLKKSEQALGKKINNNKCYIKNLISRKKQVVPPFTKFYN